MSKLISKIVVPDSSEATGYALYNVKDANAIRSSEKGVASGVATLDSSGKVPSSQLPSYVDDVIEGYYHDGNFYNTFTPGEDPDPDIYSDLITPETGKIYVDKATNYTYRWSGSVYIMIGSPDDNEEVQIGGNTPTDPGIKLYVDESANGYGAFQLSTDETTGTDTFTAIGAATIINDTTTGTDAFTF